MPKESPFTPYALRDSIFERTQAKNALRLRDRFTKNSVALTRESATVMMELFEALHFAARCEREYVHLKNKEKGPKRAYGGKPSERRAKPEALIPAPGKMNNRFAAFYKLRDISCASPDSSLPMAQRAAAGAEAVREHVSALQKTGLTPRELEISDALEAEGWPAYKRPIEEEALAVFRSATSASRFRILDVFHKATDAAGRPADPLRSLLAEHRARQRRLTDQACLILSQFERDLRRDTRNFSPLALSQIENRYHVAAMPAFPKCCHVRTRTMRIVIAMVASRSVNGTSNRLHIDPVIAREVAKKLNAYLAKMSRSTGGNKILI